MSSTRAPCCPLRGTLPTARAVTATVALPHQLTHARRASIASCGCGSWCCSVGAGAHSWRQHYDRRTLGATRCAPLASGRTRAPQSRACVPVCRNLTCRRPRQSRRHQRKLELRPGACRTWRSTYGRRAPNATTTRATTPAECATSCTGMARCRGIAVRRRSAARALIHPPLPPGSQSVDPRAKVQVRQDLACHWPPRQPGLLGAPDTRHCLASAARPPGRLKAGQGPKRAGLAVMRQARCRILGHPRALARVRHSRRTGGRVLSRRDALPRHDERRQEQGQGAAQAGQGARS